MQFVCLQKLDLYEAMFTALVQDRVDFVQLFIDSGVDLKRLLTVRRLRDLYDDVSVARHDSLTSLEGVPVESSDITLCAL